MNEMKIACDASGARVDDSSAFVKDNFLILSPRMFGLFIRYNCTTYYEVITFVKTFASDLKQMVHWSDDDFNTFKNNLERLHVCA